MLKKIFITLTLITSMVGIGALPAYASPFSGSSQEACQGANLGSSGTCEKDASGKKINSLVAMVINLLSFIVGVIAVIMIIVNGLRFITSSGDTNSVTAARNGIIYAIIGLVFVAFAQIIVRFVLTKL